MAPHGAGGLSSILPKVQIYLRDFKDGKIQEIKSDSERGQRNE